MTRPIDRNLAARHARVAQGTAATLAVAGIALAVFGLPGQKAPASPPATTDLPDAVIPHAGTDAGPLLTPVDFHAVSARMGLLSNAPKAEAVAVNITDPVSPPPAPPPPPPPPVRYLGMVALGSARLALVQDGGKQRFVGVGAKLSDGTTITSILDDRILVEGPGGETSIPLAPRSGDLLTHAAPRAGGTGAMAAMNGTVPGMNPTGFNSQGGRAPASITPGASTPSTGPTPAALAAAERARQAAARKGSGGMKAARDATDTKARQKTYTDAKGVVRDADGNPVNNPLASGRADELRDKLKSSGRFQSSEELEAALREMLAKEGGTTATEESPK